MEKFTFPPFGKIDLSSLDDNYTAEIDVNGITVDLNLFFEFVDVSERQVYAMKCFIDQIPNIDIQNRIYIDKEYDNVEGQIVKEYLTCHLEQLDEEDLYELVDFGNQTINPEKQLYNHMKLCRVTLHCEPDDKLGFNSFFEYSVCNELTDCVIVVATNGFGKPNDLYLAN